jgi:hypothetical protein
MSNPNLEKLAKELIKSVLKGKHRQASVPVASQREADLLFVKIHRPLLKRDASCIDIKLRGIPFLLLLCRRRGSKTERFKILIYWPYRLTGEMPVVAAGWATAERYLNRPAK